MELRYTFDPDRYYLGGLCKRGHSWPGTQQSLRRVSKSRSGKNCSPCVGCVGRKLSDWLISFVDYEASGFPPNQKLGKLCPRGHQWNELDLSLRGADGKCIECERIRKRNVDPVKRRAWQIAWQERLGREEVKRRNARRSAARWLNITEAERSRRNQHKAKVREALRQQGLTIRGTEPVHPNGALALADIRNRAAAKAAAKRELAHRRKEAKEQARIARESDPGWQARKSEARRLAQLARYESDPEFRLYHRQKSKRRKAIERGSIGVHVKGKQVRARFAEFDHRCAYCGASGDLHIEHVVPISKGGTHVLGNIVPACKRCNLSKRDKDAETWYRAQPWFGETRWRKILRVLGLTKGSPAQLALL